MLTLLLVGCPLIFGPPDFSQVDADATDDEPDPPDPPTDTGTPETTETVGVTGDTGPVAIPPEIVSLTADPSIDGVAFVVEVDDADGDMSGGDLTIDGAGAPQVIHVPEDVLIENGQMKFSIPAGDPCASWEYSFEVVAHDALDNESPVVELVTVGTGSGEAPVGPSFMDLGPIAPSWTVCGSIDVNNQTDVFAFSLAAATQIQFQVWWDGGITTDLDISVYDSAFNLMISGASTIEPELVEVGLPGGDTYTVQIYHYGGPRPQLYQLLLLRAP